MEREKLDTKYAVGLLEELVGIESVYPHEKQIMCFLEDTLKSLGLGVRRYEVERDRFCISVRLGGGKPRCNCDLLRGKPILCLNAHADTVPINGESIPQARVVGDRMHGLGSCDDKASLAAMITALRGVIESKLKLRGTLDLLISVDEEGRAKGVKTAIEEGYRCDYAVVGEPTSLRIVNTHAGVIFLKLKVKGTPVHGSTPWNGVNPIDMTYELVKGLQEVVERRPSHEAIGRPSLNLGAIRSGDVPNRVPEVCESLIDIRLMPKDSAAKVLEDIGRYCSKEKWGGRVSYEIIRQCEPMETDKGSILVRSLAESIEEVQKKAEISVWRAWAEAASFRKGLGIDTVVFGPGDLGQAHSDREFVDLNEVRTATQVYFNLIWKMLSSV